MRCVAGLGVGGVDRVQVRGMTDGSGNGSGPARAPLAEWAEMADPAQVAQGIVLADEQGKDADAALLLTVLSRRDPGLFAQAFGKIITSGGKLRRFVGCIRAGQSVDRLADPARIAAAGVGPFRLMCLLRSLDPSAPDALRTALEDALNRAVADIPPFTRARWWSAPMSSAS
ncbi:MAG: hypothetical protein CFE34_02045 [Rhodobacteraceae bacterium PARR1]|nr:MAG: hypothetical protein CFE34_02045 [Rhodobacteraceae bacterium PARR1]